MRLLGRVMICFGFAWCWSECICLAALGVLWCGVVDAWLLSV